MTQHTPGPWRYEASTKTIRSVPANYWLASMNSWDGAVDHDANAHLIAAAPDLLAAAQRISAWIKAGCDPSDKSVAGLHAAIARATGAK